MVNIYRKTQYITKLKHSEFFPQYYTIKCEIKQDDSQYNDTFFYVYTSTRNNN